MACVRLFFSGICQLENTFYVPLNCHFDGAKRYHRVLYEPLLYRDDCSPELALGQPMCYHPTQ